MQTAPIVALVAAILRLAPAVSPDRAEGIALDVAAVTHDTGERALLLAIASLESGFRAEVDDGREKGDGGRACTLWQLQGEGCPVRRDAARIALRKVRQSFAACRGNAPADRLAAYASGSCDRGLEASRNRIALARRVHAMLTAP